MRPVEKGITPKIYNEYGKAKDDLIEKIGCYCSYCEININNQADVEHVIPKSIRKDLKLKWDNFLLGCKACNTIKGNNNKDRLGYPFPDEWNTAMLYDYSNGLVKIKDNLPPHDEAMAENLFRLLKLDRRIDTSSKKDDRFRSRKIAYEKATDSLSDYLIAPSPAMARVIGRSVEGFHSVWLQVFNNYPDVKKAILEGVDGTAMNCYDNNYNPVSQIIR